MDIAESIRDLRESTGMSRKEFSEHTGIPVRTLEDWEAGRRTPPEYIPRLLAYQIKFEGIFSVKGEVKGKRSVSVIKDVDGNNIVIINDIRFKGKRSIDWKDVREYLKEYVGEFYTIAATGIPEMIEIAVGKHFRENHEDKHKRDAKNGWYRYDSRFALPVYDDKGELERYNVFHASMLVRHSNDGKLYLYDVIDIKKETSNSLGE